MQLLTFCLLMVTTFVIGATQDDCNTPGPSKYLLSLHQNIQLSKYATRQPSIEVRAPSAARPYKVDVIVNVVTGSTDEQTNYTHEVFEQQIASLNTYYRPTKFSFALQNISWTTNERWTLGEPQDVKDMMQKLRQGKPTTLELYYVRQIKAPFGSASGVTLDYAGEGIDGCAVTFRSMQRRPTALPHEVGHWLGLIHTFEGGCEGPNDFVDDTPPEANGAHGCFEGRRSCPDQNKDGFDPVHNFMTYPPDSCRNEFTRGQVERMHDIWSRSRNPPGFKPSPPLILNQGQLPYYPFPQNYEQGARRCENNQRDGKPAKENDCGSVYWCSNDFWRSDAKQKQYRDAVSCLKDRLPPKAEADIRKLLVRPISL